MKDVLSTFAFTYRLAEVQDAASVTRVAMEFLERAHQQPFFLFLHYWDTHTPYNCPRSFLPRDPDKNDPSSRLTARYHGAVRYVDLQLGQLFSRLKERRLWDDTLLVVTSDHGDSLTEHGIYFDHHGLYEETTHTPLILHYPARWTGGKRVQSFSQHVDLVPTICNVAGVPIPGGVDGSSLVPIINGELEQVHDCVFMEESYVQRKAALRTDRFKYIQAVDGKGWCRYCEKIHVGSEELYDLLNDPSESMDISQTQPVVAQEMQRRLSTIIAALDQKRQTSTRGGSEGEPVVAPVDEESMIRKRLKSLGYLSE